MILCSHACNVPVVFMTKSHLLYVKTRPVFLLNVRASPHLQPSLTNSPWVPGTGTVHGFKIKPNGWQSWLHMLWRKYLCNEPICHCNNYATALQAAYTGHIPYFQTVLNAASFSLHSVKSCPTHWWFDYRCLFIEKSYRHCNIGPHHHRTSCSYRAGLILAYCYKHIHSYTESRSCTSWLLTLKKQRATLSGL